MTRPFRFRWILSLLVVAVVAVVAVVLARSRTHEAPQQYRTVAADRGDVTMTVTATGTLSAVTTVQVGSQVSGIIQSLYADFNTKVNRGQLLAELDPTPFRAQVEQRQADVTQAEVQLRNSEIAFRRQQRLLDSGLTSEAEYDAAKADHDARAAQLEQAKAALAQAETNLRYTAIRSPIDGVVVSRQYDVGQTVAASFQAPTLFTIAQDLTKMQVQADVDQADIGQVAVGQLARFTVDAYPERPFTGRITQVRLNATVNQNVITYPVIIEVANPDGELRPQMTADVSIEVATARDVLRVPNAALRFRPPEEASAAAEESAGATGAAAGENPPAAGAAGGRAHGAGAPGAGGFTGRRPGAHGGPMAGAIGREGAVRRVVWVLGSGGELHPVHIATGISDGRFTAVVGGELTPGAPVVVGQATARAPESRGMRMRGF